MFHSSNAPERNSPVHQGSQQSFRNHTALEQRHAHALFGIPTDYSVGGSLNRGGPAQTPSEARPLYAQHSFLRSRWFLGLRSLGLGFLRRRRYVRPDCRRLSRSACPDGHLRQHLIQQFSPAATDKSPQPIRFETLVRCVRARASASALRSRMGIAVPRQMRQ